mmetsp:Transcript_3893/g.6801  ORF Transcript_3893/g.6801 Transcript_3893/m.6801 type:complete len:475 (-) Transcript_3893:3916-5340(-)
MLHESAIWACICYSITNTLMTLLNKALFSRAEFNYPWFTLGAQNCVAALTLILLRFPIVATPRARKLFSKSPLTNSSNHSQSLSTNIPVSVSEQQSDSDIESRLLYTNPNTLKQFAGRPLLSTELIRQLIIPICAFVFFIFSNAMSLRYLSLPIVTVFKSLAPVAVTLLERSFFGDRFGTDMYVSMALVILSTVVTFAYDLEFSWVGYIWAIVNVVANVAYLFSLRFFVSERYGAFEKAFHSNVLSLLPIIPLSILSGELPAALTALKSSSLVFLLGFTLSGTVALFLVSSSFWVLSLANGATLSLLGSLNKIPIVLLGYFLFGAKMSFQGWIGVVLGLVAGAFFVQRKAVYKVHKASGPHNSPVPTPVTGSFLTKPFFRSVIFGGMPSPKPSRSDANLAALDRRQGDQPHKPSHADVMHTHSNHSPIEIHINGTGSLHQLHKQYSLPNGPEKIDLGPTVYEMAAQKSSNRPES